MFLGLFAACVAKPKAVAQIGLPPESEVEVIQSALPLWAAYPLPVLKLWPQPELPDAVILMLAGQRRTIAEAIEMAPKAPWIGLGSAESLE